MALGPAPRVLEFDFDAGYPDFAFFLLGLFCVCYAGFDLAMLASIWRRSRRVETGETQDMSHETLVRAISDDEEMHAGMRRLYPILAGMHACPSYEKTSASYRVLIAKTRISKAEKVLDNAVFLPRAGGDLVMTVSSRRRTIRHECLHVFQEAAYGVLTMEVTGRLSPRRHLAAEFEVNYANRAWTMFLVPAVLASVAIVCTLVQAVVVIRYVSGL